MHLLAHMSYICSNHFLSNHLIGKGRKKSPFADQHLDGCQRCPDFQKAVQKVTEPLLLQSELHRNEGSSTLLQELPCTPSANTISWSHVALTGLISPNCVPVCRHCACVPEWGSLTSLRCTIPSHSVFTFLWGKAMAALHGLEMLSRDYTSTAPVLLWQEDCTPSW